MDPGNKPLHCPAGPAGKFGGMSNVPGATAPPSPQSRIHGCLLGGALGDSLGYAIEFDSITAIRGRFGEAGLRGFEALDGGSHFSDDTQMTLYTVDGLVEAAADGGDRIELDGVAEGVAEGAAQQAAVDAGRR